MATLKEKLAQIIPGLREEIKALVKEHGAKVISEVTIEQLYGGQRGIKCLVCDTSEVPPDKGLIIREKPIGEIKDKLPEEIFYLLCTGELPDAAALKALQTDLEARQEVPTYVWDVLKAMPNDSHPMVMLNTAILVMEKESIFRKKYNEGMKKDVYWDATLEDALNLIARLPNVAAAIYRMRFNKGNIIPPKKGVDWSANYVHMLGLPDPNGEFTKLMQLYLTLHSDHESGNVSAATTATVSSALSDLYYAVSAGLSGLAGPLHGLANQECLSWILETNKKFNGKPTPDQLKTYAQETLNAGRVVPGYGHAVLRITDPRFDAFLAFGKKYCAGDPVFETVANVFDVVPEVLKQVQKIKDPWPNVDAGSGALLYHFGMKEFDYYTVLFSVSRALGVAAQAIIARAMGYPIVRPKSVPTKWVKAQAAK